MTPLRRYPALFFVCLAMTAGCGQLNCGCGEVPLAEDMPEPEKVYDGILAEVSPAGFQFIENNFDGIVAQFLNGSLAVDLPPSASCDTGAGCGGQAICQQGTPCPIDIAISNVGLSTAAPDRVRLGASLDVTSQATIPVQVCQDLFVSCGTASCGLDIHISNKPVSADVKLGTDPLMKTMSVDVLDPDVTLENGDFTITGGALCDIVDFIKPVITGLLSDQIKSQLTDQIQQTIDDGTCMACDYFGNGCAGVVDPGGATCDTGKGWCMSGGSCVRAPQGLVGTIDVGATLGSVGSGEAPLDLFIAPGQATPPTADPHVQTDGGSLQLRLISGSNATLAPCVPPASTVPSVASPPRVDFATEAGTLPWHVGIGASDRFLDKVLYDVYRSGALCLNLSSSTIDLLTSGLIQTFVGSLNSLTEGRNVPMIIALRPKDRPEATIGAGTFKDDGAGNTIIDEPLITIRMPNTHMDFYALVEERYVRLFTLKMDLEVPLGLELTPNNELLPVLGPLDSLAQNIEPLNTDLVAEDPAVLADIIPSIIGLAEPMLAGALSPIALPDLQGFKLNVQKMAGMRPVTGVAGEFEHLGILAELELAGTPATAAAETRAEIRTVERPDGAALEVGTVVLDVKSFDGRRDSPGTEWQVRVDGGFWSPFQQGERWRLQSPKFRLQGWHTVEVRARTIGAYQTLDPTPARLEVLVDWEAPTARLSIDHETGEAEVFARDLVSASVDLEYSYSVDDGAFTGWSPEARYRLPRDYGKVIAQVRDEAGNTHRLTWSSPRYIHGRPPAPTSGSGGCACTSTEPGAVGLWAGLLLLVGLVRRRR